MTRGTFRPMRVLVVSTQEPWPLDTGYRLHGYHLLRELARRAEVTLALPGTARHRERLPANIRTETMVSSARRAVSTPSGDRHVSWILRLVRRHFGYNEAIETWIRRMARPERFDVALLNGAVFGQHVAAFGVPVVWNPQDELVLPAIREAEYGGWRSWPTALRCVALYALFERYVVRRAAATIFVSALDAAYVRRWVGDARVEVVQNGVDCEYFRPSEEAPEPGTVVFVGSLEFPPNVDGVVHFATRIWPRIYARGRGRRLLVVGRRPVAAVKALTALPAVELAADVPDVRPYLARASAVVVPIRGGGGLKNKVLEACAMRRPVVATPRALAGLSARIGVDVLPADRVHSWVRRLSRLLERPTYAETVAQAGHAWVRRAHRWSTLGDRFIEILDAVRRTWQHGRRGTVTRPVAPAASCHGRLAYGQPRDPDDRAESRWAVLGDDGTSHDVAGLPQELVCR